MTGKRGRRKAIRCEVCGLNLDRHGGSALIDADEVTPTYKVRIPVEFTPNEKTVRVMNVTEGQTRRYFCSKHVQKGLDEGWTVAVAWSGTLDDSVMVSA